MEATTILIKALDQASWVIWNVKKNFQDLMKTASKDSKEMSKSLQDSSKWLEVLRNAWAVWMVAVWAWVVSATNAFNDFEKQMSSAKSVLGLFWSDTTTQNQFRQLSDLAIKLWADSKFTAKEAAEGITILWQAGFSTSEIMQSLKGTMDLAAATNISIADSADIASSVLRQYWIDTAETSRVMDVLAKTSIESNADILNLRDSFNYFWPTAKAMGISLEESSAMIWILANSGIKWSAATRALWTSLTRLSNPTKKMAWAMREASLETFDAQGNFVWMASIIEQLRTNTEGWTQEQKMATISAIFWADALWEMLVLIDAWPEKLRNFTKELQNAWGSTEKMAKAQLDNTKWSVELLSWALDSLKISVWASFSQIQRNVADALTPIVSWLADWTAKNPLLTQSLIVVWWALTTFATILWGIWLALPTIKAWLTVLTWLLPTVWAWATGAWAWVWMFWTALSVITWPIWIAIAAVAWLVVAWNTNFLGLRDFVMWVINWIANWFNKFWTEIFPSVQQAFLVLKIFVAGILTDLQKFFEPWFNWIQTTWDFTWSWVLQAFQWVWQMISSAVQIWIELIKTIFKAWLAIITWDWDSAWKQLLKSWEIIWNQIKTFFSWLWNAIQGTIVAVFWAIATYFTVVWWAILNTLKNWWSSVMSWWNSHSASIKKAISDTWNSITTSTTQAWNDLMKILWDFINSIVQLFNDSVWAVQWAFKWMFDWIASIAQWIFDWVMKVINWFIGWIQNAVNTAINLANKLPWVNISTIWWTWTAPKKYATGWIVSGPAGIDKVPALLTAWEMVLTAAQQKNLAWNLQGWKWNITVVFSPTVYWVEDRYVEEMFDEFIKKFQSHTKLNYT